MTSDRKCDRCSAHVRLEAQFCPSCGMQMAESKDSSPGFSRVGNSSASLSPDHLAGPGSQVSDVTETREDLAPGKDQGPSAGTCPACSYRNLPGASICERCNAKMWMIDRIKSATSLEQPQQQSLSRLGAGSATQLPSPHPSIYGATNNCERCGTTNRLTAISCDQCGLPLENRSPEGVPIEVFRHGDPAGFWIRFFALILDITIVFGIGAIIWPLLFGETFWIKETTVLRDGVNQTTSTTFRTQDWHILMWLSYSILFMAFLGATPGKMAFRVRVYDGGGRRGIGFFRATIRTFSMWLSMLTLLIGFIMAGVRGDKRALHDLIAGTYPTSGS